MLNLPLFGTSFSISGVFDGATDTFDLARHKINVNVRKGTVLRNAAQHVKVTKVSVASKQPKILEVKDSISGKVDSILCSDGAVEIAGIDIKLVGDKPAVGLYFTTEDGTDIKASTIMNNKPSLLIALIPALTAGIYRIKVVTQYNGSYNLREPRTTIYEKPFIVEDV
jgi:hypothetical protein